MTPELRKQAAKLLTDLYPFASFAVDSDDTMRGSWGIKGNGSGLVTLTDDEAMHHICKEHERLAKERDVRWELMKELMTAIMMDEPNVEIPERDIVYMRRLLDSKEKQIKAHHDLWKVKRARKKQCGVCPRKDSCEDHFAAITRASEKYQAAMDEHTKEGVAAQLEYEKEIETEEVKPAKRIGRLISESDPSRLSEEAKKPKPIIRSDSKEHYAAVREREPYTAASARTPFSTATALARKYQKIRDLAEENKKKCSKCGVESEYIQISPENFQFGKYYTVELNCSSCSAKLGSFEVQLGLTPEGLITFSHIRRENSWVDAYYTEDEDEEE